MRPRESNGIGQWGGVAALQPNCKLNENYDTSKMFNFRSDYGLFHRKGRGNNAYTSNPRFRALDNF